MPHEAPARADDKTRIGRRTAFVSVLSSLVSVLVTIALGLIGTWAGQDLFPLLVWGLFVVTGAAFGVAAFAFLQTVRGELRHLEQELDAEQAQLVDCRLRLERHSKQESERLAEQLRTQQEAAEKAAREERARLRMEVAEERARLRTEIAEERGQLRAEVAEERREISVQLETDRSRLDLERSEIDKQAMEASNLMSLMSLVPLDINFERRTDRFVIHRNGDADLYIYCDVSTEHDEGIPYIDFPIMAEISEDETPWSSFGVSDILVDGESIGVASSVFKKRSRRMIEGDDPFFQGIVSETGVVRVPLNLGGTRNSTNFMIHMKLNKAFVKLLDEEMCYTDVPYLTRSISVSVRGGQGVRVVHSPERDHKVEAFQGLLSVRDYKESERASRSAHIINGIEWSYDLPKLGYRYRVPFRAAID